MTRSKNKSWQFTFSVLCYSRCILILFEAIRACGAFTWEGIHCGVSTVHLHKFAVAPKLWKFLEMSFTCWEKKPAQNPHVKIHFFCRYAANLLQILPIQFLYGEVKICTKSTVVADFAAQMLEFYSKVNCKMRRYSDGLMKNCINSISVDGAGYLNSKFVVFKTVAKNHLRKN